MYAPIHVSLDPTKPMTVGPFGGPEVYQELRYAQYKAMQKVPSIIDDVFRQYNEKFKREYKKVEEYLVNDADILLLTMGSISGTILNSIEQMRKKGKKVGVIKLTVYRPFPEKEIIDAIQNFSPNKPQNKHYGDGTASNKIVEILENSLDNTG